MSTVGLTFSFKEIVLNNKKKVKLKLIDTGAKKSTELYLNHISKMQMEFYLFIQ